MKNELSNLIVEYFPHTDPHFILFNRLKIESFFKFKDTLPNALRSDIVYKYIVAINARRTPLFSIRDHALSCNSDINLSDFIIVASMRYEIPLRITESIFILQISPKLNDLDSAFPLNLFPPPTLFSS